MDAFCVDCILTIEVITVSPTSGATRRRRFAAGMVALGSFSGLLLGLAVSGGIAGERLTLGATAMGTVANALATVAALVAATIATRRTQVAWVELPLSPEDGPAEVGRLHPLAVLVPQVVGAIVGVAAVHVLLREGTLGHAPWLSERPAQLVNDGVAVFGLLALAWACASNLDGRVLFAALLVLTVYRLTGARWHVDHAPAGFRTTVQQFVVAQFVAAAVAMALARTLRVRRTRESS